jgi:hypothetical protein
MPTVNILVDWKATLDTRGGCGGNCIGGLITNFLSFTRITIISRVREFKATLAGTCVNEFK